MVAVPDSAFGCNADADPDVNFNADLDPAIQLFTLKNAFWILRTRIHYTAF
jgi:hypothetical protein